MYAENGGLKNWASLPCTELKYWITENIKYISKDVFLSQNTFKDNQYRKVANIADFQCLFSEIDFYKKDRYENLYPDGVYDDIQAELEKENIPLPSLVIFSGRGLYCIWLIEPIQIDSLALWNSKQLFLYEKLKEFGADPVAKDGARVLRLVGTENTKSGQQVRVFDGTNKVYKFEDIKLPKEYLEKQQRKIITSLDNPYILEAEKILWSKRLNDLLRLPFAFGGKIPYGQRDVWIFLVYNAFAWIGDKRYWYRGIGYLEKFIDQPSKFSIDRFLSTLDQRTQEHSEGQQGWNKGLYYFRTKTIVDYLGLDKATLKKFNMFTLRGKPWYTNEEKTILRRAQGIPERSVYLERATKADKKEVIKLEKEGYSQRAIAKQLNISQSRVYQILKN